MDEMIERVARAMAKQRYEKDNAVGITASAISRDLYVDKRWTDFEEAARAAILVMRDPTPRMIEAAHDRLADDGEIVDVYQAMIDAASNTIPIADINEIDRAD